jgi:nickel/cobalt transporter (NiCoT) family protein
MDNAVEEHVSLLNKLSNKAALYHERVPVVRTVPLKSILIIVILIGVNIFVWIGCGIVLVFIHL